MKILFILGNGFDINLGLKTRYQDFYDVYSKNHSNHDLVMKLKNHISKNTNGYWSDLELALGEYTKEFKNIEDFDTVMEDIILSLSKYLKNIQSNFNKSNIKCENFFHDLDSPENYLTLEDQKKILEFKDKFQNSSWTTSIVSFNYTNIVEQILEDTKDSDIGSHQLSNQKIRHILNKRIQHIHGYVDNKMVLGVNDLTQVANNELHENLDIQESIVKSKCNEANGDDSILNFENKIENADLICAFGLSYGDSDKVWWEKIGERLRNSNSHMIIFDRSKHIDNTLSYKNNRLRRNIKNHFLNQTKLPESAKDTISNRIYVGVNTDMFQKIVPKPTDIEVADKFGDAKIDLVV